MLSSILAATVLFTGLICHVETNSATHAKDAVLVDATGHDAILQITSGFASDSGNWAKTTSGDYDLKREQLVIKGGSGPVKVNGDFDFRVPHLKAIIGTTTDDIHPDIYSGKPHNSTAMIAYDHGTLGIAGCYTDNEIRFNPPETGKDPRCLAKVIELDFMAGSNWRIEEVGNPAKYIELNAGATIMISNLSKATGAHYKEYTKLLKNSSTVNDMQHTGRKCTSGCSPFQPMKSSTKHGPTVECSNSQWP